MRVCWASAYQWSQEVERVGKTLNKCPGENGGKESLPKKKTPKQISKQCSCYCFDEQMYFFTLSPECIFSFALRKKTLSNSLSFKKIHPIAPFKFLTCLHLPTRNMPHQILNPPLHAPWLVLPVTQREAAFFVVMEGSNCQI